MQKGKKRLGNILLGAGIINPTQLSAALQSQKQWGGKLGSTLVSMGFARESDILRTLSSQLLLPAVDFNKIKIAPSVIKALPLRLAERFEVVPVSFRGEGSKRHLVIAMSDPTNVEAINEIRFQIGLEVLPAVATHTSIKRAIDHYYKNAQFSPGEPKRLDPIAINMDDDEPMIIINTGEQLKSDNKFSSLTGPEMAKMILRILVRKGLVSKADIEKELDLM